MTLVEKFRQKNKDICSARPITLAFLGDSVTQGCFELITENTGNANVVYDGEAVYHNQIRQILSMFYPNVPVTIVNAGISGDTAKGGLKRLERDVLSYHPDLTVVCFGLNDAGWGQEMLETYINSLREIFIKVKENGSALIFLTPNVIGNGVHPSVTDPKTIELATGMCTKEKNELLDLFITSAISLCEEMNIDVCDCYSLWKQMRNAEIDTTRLLSNSINHPNRQMHKLFAYELVKMILGGRI